MAKTTITNPTPPALRLPELIKEKFHQKGLQEKYECISSITTKMTASTYNEVSKMLNKRHEETSEFIETVFSDIRQHLENLQPEELYSLLDLIHEGLLNTKLAEKETEAIIERLNNTEFKL